MIAKNISIIGLPESGKTTYIAALWALMLNNSPHCSLVLDTLKEGNQSYMNSIADDWLAFREIGRTMLAKDLGEVVMSLKNNKTQQLTTLNIPDFYGELFDAHFKDREWAQDYYQQVLSSNEFILFLDPFHENNIARTIMDERAYMEQFDELMPIMEAPGLQEKMAKEEVLDENESQESLPGKLPKVYKHIDTSNQVKLVEILQFLIFTLNLENPINIAVVVSKWDKVISNFPDKTPEQLISSNLPLLHQFLLANQNLLTFNFFGVSAQGVDYSDKKAVLNFADKLPEDRVEIFDGRTKSKDIATPITWLTR